MLSIILAGRVNCSMKDKAKLPEEAEEKNMSKERKEAFRKSREYYKHGTDKKRIEEEW